MEMKEEDGNAEQRKSEIAAKPNVYYTQHELAVMKREERLQKEIGNMMREEWEDKSVIESEKTDFISVSGVDRESMFHFKDRSAALQNQKQTQ